MHALLGKKLLGGAGGREGGVEGGGGGAIVEKFRKVVLEFRKCWPIVYDITLAIHTSIKLQSVKSTSPPQNRQQKEPRIPLLITHTM